MAKWYSYLFKENAYGFGIQIATFIGGVATTLVLPNIMGKDGFGAFSLVVGIASAALLFSDWGMQLSVLKFLPAWAKSGVAGNYFRRMLAAKVMLSIAVALALYFCADAIAGAYQLPALASGMRVGASFFFFYSLYMFLENVFIGLQRTRVSFAMGLVFHSLRVVLPVAAFLSLGSYEGAVAGIAAAALLVVAVGLFGAKSGGLFAEKKGARLATAELYSYLRYGALWYAAVLAVQWSDTLVLGLFRGVGDVAVYRVAWMWAAATGFLFPFSNRILIAAHAGEGDERSRKLFDVTMRYALVFAFLMVAGIVLVSGQFLDFVYRGQYSGAYPVLAILSLLSVESSMNAISSAVLVGRGDIKSNSIVLALAAIAQTIAVAVLAGPYGAVGAAIGVASVRIASAFVQLFLALRLIRLPFRLGAFARPFACFAVTCIALYPLEAYAQSLPGAVLLGIGAVALYSGLAVAVRAFDVKEALGLVKGVVSG